MEEKKDSVNKIEDDKDTKKAEDIEEEKKEDGSINKVEESTTADKVEKSTLHKAEDNVSIEEEPKTNEELAENIKEEFDEKARKSRVDKEKKKEKEEKIEEEKTLTIYQVAYKRRAVRKFKENPISEDKMIEIKNYLLQILPLDNCHADFKIVNAGSVKDKKAPHYVLAYCENTTANYINVGYILAKLDLYIQSIGLGSVFLGMATPNEKEEKFCIMLAFGETDIPLRYGDIDFDRLPINKIANVDNIITQMAKFAPSAMNSQPWFIDYKKDKITINYQKRGLLLAPILKKKMSKIDIGIILRFVVLAINNKKEHDLKIEVFDTKKTYGVVIEVQREPKVEIKKVIRPDTIIDKEKSIEKENTTETKKEIEKEVVTDTKDIIKNNNIEENDSNAKSQENAKEALENSNESDTLAGDANEQKEREEIEKLIQMRLALDDDEETE